MKARQANLGGGPPTFFISNKDGKKGLFFRSSNNEDYIDPSLGKIHVEQGKEGKNIYVQYFESLTGIIKDVKVKKTFREMPGKGKVKGYDITVEMDSDGTIIKIMFSFDTGYGRKFAERFKNMIKDIKREKEFTLKPYNFIPKDKTKAVVGMNIFYGDSIDPQDAYKSYYDEHNTPDFNIEGRDGLEYDFKSASNWLYKKFIEDVYQVFDHYEEEEKEENDNGRRDDKYDPGNRKDYRDNMDADRKSSGRDDDRRSSRNDDRDERRSSRDDDRKSSRDRDDERRPSRDDERRSSRDDDRRGREDDDDEYDREERRESRRSDNKSADDIPKRREREEVKEMSKEEFEEEKRAKRDSGSSDKRDSRDNYSATGGMERRSSRNADDNEDDLPF